MDHGDFHNRIHLAEEDVKVWPWIDSFLSDLLDAKTSRLFDEYFRHVMDGLV